MDGRTWTPANYIETANPFNLAAPPVSFLRDLHAYDPELRIFPSLKEPVYRLCRRSQGKSAWEKLPHGHPDNPITIANKLTPLKAIQGFKPAWGQTLINALAGCDVQRVGGGTAAAELLDQQEELEARRLNARIADEAEQRAATAYRTIGYIQGSRVSLGSSTPEGTGYVKNPFALRSPEQPRGPRRVFRPRAAGEHAIFVGR